MQLLILHHPLRSAWCTPTRRPIARAVVVYHDAVILGQRIEARDKSRFVHITIIKEEDSSFHVQGHFSYLNKHRSLDREFDLRKDCRHTVCEELCDALESWDFVLSDHAITVGQWLGGYSQDPSGIWTRNADRIFGRNFDP